MFSVLCVDKMYGEICWELIERSIKNLKVKIVDKKFTFSNVINSITLEWNFVQMLD